MDTPRKTPRTDAAVSKHSFLDGSRELNPDITPFIRTLEIETQELADHLEKLLLCTMHLRNRLKPAETASRWEDQATAALAAHKAKQPE